MIASRYEVFGRGHAERLVPMIAELPGGGRAGDVLVDCGPGSFTGVRVGLAAAIGLGIGWSVSVRGFSSLALVAAAGFARHVGVDRLAVVMDGGHGEVFMQVFVRAPFASLAPLASRKPADARGAIGETPVIGSGLRWLEDLGAGQSLGEALPAAADAILLPAEFTALDARPIYGRAPDAKPQVGA